MTHLRSTFLVTGLAEQSAVRCVSQLEEEFQSRPWLVRPIVQWSLEEQSLRVAFEAEVANDAIVELPVLVQQQQLADCLASCSPQASIVEIEDFLFVN